MSPKRIQMSRQRPWRAESPDAVVVARPSKWGNPFKVYRCTCCGYWDVIDNNGMKYLIDHEVARKHPEWANDKREAVLHAIELFGNDLDWCARISREEVRAELAGKDLACWCPPDQPCHADVLLELANEADR